MNYVLLDRLGKGAIRSVPLEQLSELTAMVK